MTCLHPFLVRTGRPCEYCRFYVALGRIVDFANRLETLDAVADLLTHHARTERAHRRERNEDARDAQRAASIAYTEGHDAALGGEW